MMEERSRTSIYDKCNEYVIRQPLVRLKGKKPEPGRFEDFFKDSLGRFEVWNGKLVKRMVRTSSRSAIRQAAGLFANHGALLADHFVADRFGSWEAAMEHYGRFEPFFNGFLEYFAERKQQFMDKTEELIKQTHNGITEMKIKTPHSHGGVANLLKVLTKTMHEQGSSIRTIAKVQYAVCIQAGIFVPEEFITDVLVAANIDQKVWEEGKPV